MLNSLVPCYHGTFHNQVNNTVTLHLENSIFMSAFTILLSLRIEIISQLFESIDFLQLQKWNGIAKFFFLLLH